MSKSLLTIEQMKSAVRFNRKAPISTADWMRIQAALGLKGRHIDGVVGPVTVMATAEFQHREGLLVDGKVGKQTLPKLLALSERDDPIPPEVYIADVSRYQRQIDFTRFLESGNLMAIIRTSQGADYVDPLHAKFSQDAKAVGVPRGFYHFCTPFTGGVNDVEQELEHFIRLVDKQAMTPLLLMLDFETKGLVGDPLYDEGTGKSRRDPGMYAAWMVEFFEVLQDEFPSTKLLLYAGASNIERFLGKHPRLLSRNLCCARYGNNDDVLEDWERARVPDGWDPDRLVAQQFTSKWDLPDVDGVDPDGIAKVSDRILAKRGWVETVIGKDWVKDLVGRAQYPVGQAP